MNQTSASGQDEVTGFTDLLFPPETTKKQDKLLETMAITMLGIKQ